MKLSEGEIGLQASVMKCCICEDSSHAIMQVPIQAKEGGGTFGVVYICLACCNDGLIKQGTECNITIYPSKTIKQLPAPEPLVRIGIGS